MTENSVRRYYDAMAVDEWRRLGGDGRVEWEIGTRLLRAVLPPGGSVADVGSGPGRWSVWLAEQGWRASAFDVSPRSLVLLRNWARHRGVDLDRVEAADARALPSNLTGRFDAALVFGPYYHATRTSDRISILREAQRIVRPGGRVLVATMPPYFRTLPLVTSSDERRFALGRRALATGVLDTGSGFPAVALTSLSTVEAELRRAGLELDSAFASQGFVSHHLEACGTLAREDPTRFGELMDLVFEHASNPATLDAAAQVVAVASKNEREGNNHREEAD